MNKQGFILIETLVVTIFVLFIFTILYNSVVPLLGKYNELSYYNDLDTTYDLYHLRNLIVGDTKYNNIKNKTYQKIQCSDLKDSLSCSHLFNILEIDSSDELIFLNINYLEVLQNDTNISYDVRAYTKYIDPTTNILILQKNGYVSYLELEKSSCYTTNLVNSYQVNQVMMTQDELDLESELALCVDYFTNNSKEENLTATEFCQNQNSTFQTMLDNENFTNLEIEELLNKGIITIDNVLGLAITNYKSTCPKRVNIPSSINSYNVVKISENAFVGKNIQTVTVPNTVTYMSCRAFDNTTSVTASITCE